MTTQTTDTTGREGPADPLPPLARKAWGNLETVHVVGYFAAEAFAAYAELGVKGMGGYFATRSAPMGAVTAGVTTATFYVFHPGYVARSVPRCWEAAPPEQWLQVRHDSVLAALRRGLGEVDAGALSELVGLVRTAAEGLSPAGRTLYAAHAGLPWPDEPLMALWHASSLVREHRGDGHLAALQVAGLDGVEAMVTEAAAKPGKKAFLQGTRGWSAEEWAAAEERLRERDLLDAGGSLTDSGRALRDELETTTDLLAEEGWRHLGEEGTARVVELATPLRKALAASDVFPPGIF